ncbi:glutamyl-tRNA reductase [Anaerobacillus alkalidiazotrophicus]|uniref:Glutamyl-tRNA reductase n=1 Tax=Anaerobacillus alkalidiazotrophicus TaxID=472963 RepID=A0A1S2M7L9_9BACI|nr:glutamyl-tRNA reductase [Anaerobacillus alkalidiazotrophicus]OIJ18348.1 glutamyl-tRNA reductase [Anaerobacillus alkalidiazotrophicus]OIJ19827.1 glutamyl-tRNA reductase [Anaerobacillus alkalidiazotrophicus]
MHILVTSLNYKSTPVEIREKFTFQNEERTCAIKRLINTKSILEGVIVSTCNRTEVYAVVDQVHTGRYYIKSFLSEWFELPMDDFVDYLDIYQDDRAIEHLLRVTCGLNSMVVGETQILGQIRESFLFAQELEATGTVFNHLFKQAITLAKRAHSETSIGENAVSVSYAAVELGKKIFGDFKNKHVLIFGAGKMSELTGKHLHANGVGKVTVINRTMSKAIQLADKFLGEARPINELTDALIDADILISSTGAKNYVVTKDMVSSIIRKRKGRPLFMVDIAVPRDIEPSLCELESVYLYDIDDLEGIVQANLDERKREAEKIEIMIDYEIAEFKNWLNTLGVVPIISSLRTKALSVHEETMASLERKLPNLSEREKKVLSKHMKSIVNQLLRDPIVAAKELAAEPNAEESLALFTRIFSLKDLTVEEKEACSQLEESAEATREAIVYAKGAVVRS